MTVAEKLLPGKREAEVDEKVRFPLKLVDKPSSETLKSMSPKLMVGSGRLRKPPSVRFPGLIVKSPNEKPLVRISKSPILIRRLLKGLNRSPTVPILISVWGIVRLGSKSK